MSAEKTVCPGKCSCGKLNDTVLIPRAQYELAQQAASLENLLGMDMSAILEAFSRSRLVVLPYAAGTKIWVCSTDHTGKKVFHNGRLLGGYAMKSNQGEYPKGTTTLVVWINDNDKEFVVDPVKEPIMDFVMRVYTKDEVRAMAEQA